MLIKIYSLVLNGLEAQPIVIETDVSKSWPGFQVIGLGDTAIQEAKERIRVAWKNTLHDWPYGKGITINLAPADLHKEGAGYDLPMAIGLYLAHREIRPPELEEIIIIGELALDGSVRPVSGILPMVQYAVNAKFKKICVPADCAAEASLISTIEILPVNSLLQLIEHLLGQKKIQPYIPKHIPSPTSGSDSQLDLKYIYGQEFAKRALEIAAAGNHNIILSGTPGSGKTLLAKTLPSILPAPDQSEIIEMTILHSAAGLLPKNASAVTSRPFRAPHHTSSTTTLLGGGRFPRPGEISLAHHGVLFLDELAEFSTHVLECLRQPLEERKISISRTKSSLTFPARILLIGSQNPCPCGFFGDEYRPCLCTKAQIVNYRKKISGPFLDRIDLHVFVPRVDLKKISYPSEIETSAQVRERVSKARNKQSERFKDLTISYNSELDVRNTKKFCPLGQESQRLLQQAAIRLHLSARGYFKIIKLARTIADLANSETILTDHLAEALHYRPQN